MAPSIYESDPMVVCDSDDDNESLVVHDANEEQQVVVDEDEEDDDDDFEKEMLVKRLNLFFTVKNSNNKDFITDNGIATPAFAKVIDNIERIRIIGMAINMSERKVKPSLFKTCDNLI